MPPFPLLVAALDGAEIAVLLGGTALIGMVLWYFFGKSSDRPF